MGQNGVENEPTVVKSKLVVVGDSGSGKTALIKRYVRGEYTDVSTTTITLTSYFNM